MNIETVGDAAETQPVVSGEEAKQRLWKAVYDFEISARLSSRQPMSRDAKERLLERVADAAWWYVKVIDRESIGDEH